MPLVRRKLSSFPAGPGTESTTQVLLNDKGLPRYGIYVGTSTDGGYTFSSRPLLMSSNLNQEPQTVVVLSDGTLAVPYHDHRTAAGARVQSRRSWLLVSGESGRTWDVPLLISEGCNRRGPVGWPSLAAGGPAEAEATNLYWICEAEEGRGILLFKSFDGGERWSEGTRIDGGAEGVWTKTPAIVVSKVGFWESLRINASLPRHSVSTCTSPHPWIAGPPFLPPERGSSAESCPSQGRNGETAARWPAGGDYSGLVAVDFETFRVVWADSRDGLYRLRTALVGLHPPVKAY